ncbi:MAG TPA: serine/threonine-protein kinase [Polyangia bacterium]|jgi:serine/threonine-protein kinase|nr:serine/threonine-protein kinase [Polyangia bacterium]
MLPYRPLMARHGRYTILGKLADGGMAEIFLATQHGAEGFEKHVVLKRILTQFSADPQFSNMFIDEAHISMSLQHSNIVQVLDLGVAGSRYFLVMELVDGWDLERILKRAHEAGMVFPPALSLHVVTVVCRALAYAHAKARGGKPLGIVHRDISPNNVLISEQGEIKLADFGIAKAQRKREQTAAGVIKGKVAYMSPEQATGAAIDKRSDIFAVGSLLYRMVTNALPFEAPSDLEQLLRVQKADLTPIDKAKPGVSPAVSDIILRAMRLNPSERYQTADEMLADVERVLRTEFQSAGQTELKLWLEQLARRDGESSIGKRRLDTSGIVKDDLGTDLSAGTSFELDEVTGHTEAAFTPPPLAGSGGAASRPETKVERAARGLTPPPALTPSPAPTSMTAPPRRRFGGFWLGAIFALGGVIGGKLLLDWAEHEGVMGKLGLGADGDRGPVQGPPAPAREEATPPAKAAPAPEKVAPVVAAPAAPADASPAPIAKASPDATAPVAEATPAKDAATAEAKAAVAEDDDTDEEELLKTAVPNAEHTVIGADGAESEGEKAEAARESGKREGAPSATTAANGKPVARGAAKAKAAPAHATAVLHLRTTPVGAIVRTKGQVLGRTPINLHFRTGNTYELTFVKSGYQPASRMVAVSNAKDKTLALSLKKRPTQKKRSIFHPHR